MKCGTSCSARTTRCGSGRPTTAQPGAWLTGSAATATNGPSGAVRAPLPLEGAPVLLRQLCRLPTGAGGWRPLSRQGRDGRLGTQQRPAAPAALRRRSIVVSKSLAMIERRVALFAHLHVNKEAAPEMYRLPIQAGGFIALA